MRTVCPFWRKNGSVRTELQEEILSFMTLYELSMEYSASAAALRGRIGALRRLCEEAGDEGTRQRLQSRIRVLTAMWRETREIAVLTEHYYDRGYRRNGKYIV